MSLTAAQLTTLKAAILAETDPSIVAARQAPANTTLIADFYNQPASPQVLIWRPKVGVDELKTGVVWSAFIALAQGNRDAWAALCQGMVVDATNANIRAGFSSVFGGGTQSLTNLTAIAQKAATRFESVFTASQVSTVFGQTLRDTDVEQALAS